MRGNKGVGYELIYRAHMFNSKGKVFFWSLREHVFEHPGSSKHLLVPSTRNGLAYWRFVFCAGSFSLSNLLTSHVIFFFISPFLFRFFAINVYISDSLSKFKNKFIDEYS